MRRGLTHTPSLFSLDEQDSNDGEDIQWEKPISARQLPSSPNLHSPATNNSLRSRGKAKQKHIGVANPPNTAFPSNYRPSSDAPRYSDVYTQFVKRYRSEPGLDGDPRNDPDSNYFHRGLGQLVDAGDSDDEDSIRFGSTPGGSSYDRYSASREESESEEPRNAQERIRLDWRYCLASVLRGQVLKSEKTRIAVALDSSREQQNNLHLNIWFGLRAKFSGRTEEDERAYIEDRRMRTVDPVIDEIINLRLKDKEREADMALKMISSLLLRLDSVLSLYPSLKMFYTDRGISTDSKFQSRWDTLNTWSNIFSTLRFHVTLLQRWTGSESLDVSKPYTLGDSSASSAPFNGPVVDITFVEKVLKDDSLQKTFERGFLTTVHSFIGTAREAQIDLSSDFAEMNLPTFESELVPLISFPTRLAQACLRVRLDYVQKLKDPELIIIDQVTEDVKISLGLACTLKRQYKAFLVPEPGKWNLPRCVSDDYDTSILEALGVFFKLIHWKLKSGAKGIYFKETDVIESQWATFHDVSMSVPGGSSHVAEQVCSLTNRLMVRVANYFDTQVRLPMSQGHWRKAQNLAVPVDTATSQMSDEQKVNWYGKILDNVRLRYRKLQRFARALAQRYSNSAEYSLEGVQLEQFIGALIASDHFLVYTRTYEAEATYIIASGALRDRADAILRILLESFHVSETTDVGVNVVDHVDYLDSDEEEEAEYLLLLSPRDVFVWNGLVFMLDLPKIELDMKDNRVRLVADGPQRRLAMAKEQFADIFLPVDDEDEESTGFAMPPLQCISQQQAHIPAVNRELRKIARATNKLAESIVDSVHHVRNSLRHAVGYQEQLQTWYSFASEHGQHAQEYMERTALGKFNRSLIRLAISWVSFVCDDCDVSDRKTFRWAIHALEFTLRQTRRNIFHMPNDQFRMLQRKVARCMELFMHHFDILGARSKARQEKERQEELRRKPLFVLDAADNVQRALSPVSDERLSGMGVYAYTDPSICLFWEKTSRAVHSLDAARAQRDFENRLIGRVLDDERPEDRSLLFLASQCSNISIRWQQRRFIGSGAFGSVYLAVNLDSGSLMAVKEIKFQELSGLPSLYAQIKDELSVMEMLQHPNVVEYYGIEVHRDKVYIFEEYCQGGSLAALLEHGRIEDESIIQLYTMQMLEGLAYLHGKGVVHRDVKPDNILLDHRGVIKFVDFGASKILAKNRTLQHTRRADPVKGVEGQVGFNSLTGTPMYMSPEVIKNDKKGRHGAMDIWSLGCVVLEFATGKKPWNNLDNEWAIMFHIGVARQHPSLPEPDQLSDFGIDFIKQCLAIDAMTRPTAVELLDHPWMLQFGETLLDYGESQLASSPPVEVPPVKKIERACVAATSGVKEVEIIHPPSPTLSSTGAGTLG